MDIQSNFVSNEDNLEKYKRDYQEIEGTEELQLEFKNLQHRLSHELNQPGIKQVAFGSQILWKVLTKGDTTAGALLKRIVFAHQLTIKGKNKLKTWRGDRYWYWHSSQQFAEELLVSTPTIDRGIKKLEKLGYINYAVYKNDFGKPCRHISLNFDFFFKSLESFIEYDSDETLKG